MLLAHFHLMCLHLTLKQRMDVPSAVVLEVLDGIGASASAYATLREGLELRDIPKLSLDYEGPIWDDEDRVLLDESERSGSPIT